MRALGVARLWIEAVGLALALVGAYLLRFDGLVPPDHLRQLLLVLPALVVVEVAALHLAGVGRHSWRYTTMRDVIDLTGVLAVVSAGLLVLRLVIGSPGPEGIAVLSLPLGVIGVNFALGVLVLSGLRVLRRLQVEASEKRGLVAPDGSVAEGPRRVLLIGAGRAGVLTARELERRPDLGMVAVGFIDDDPEKVGRRVAGLRVLGTVEDLGRIAEARRVDGAVITMASVGRSDIRRIVAACEVERLDTKIVPGLYEIVGGRVQVSRIRDVGIEDLLGRDEVHLDEGPTRELVAGRTVMVTGAGGSIGSEIVRQVARFEPACLLLVERAEPSLWAIDREVRASWPELDVEPLVADVCDEPRMAGIFDAFQPDVVVHAAAHKHVPLMESNPAEAVKNNVGGTRCVADLCATRGVERFVLISTDKAVNPSSVMGATKRIAERYVQHLARTCGLRAVTVRFGNVLGSEGSVVPIFKEQVAAGGPVTVTHEGMERYFMTIPEASQLVLQAAAIGRGGEIMILDMGEPVRIVDLAESIIRLSGFEPYVDIPIEFIGLRPGEKLVEELSLDAEQAVATRHPKIWIGASDALTWSSRPEELEGLLVASREGDTELTMVLMKALLAPPGASDS